MVRGASRRGQVYALARATFVFDFKGVKRWRAKRCPFGVQKHRDCAAKA